MAVLDNRPRREQDASMRRISLLLALVAALALTGGAVARPAAHAVSAAQPASIDCKSGYYKNVSGHCVHRPSSDPKGATAKCRDGSFSYSEHASGTCSHHGGVARWIHHP
jgi:hypothetical protein